MISRRHVRKVASEWLTLRILPQYPELYRFAIKKDRFDSLTDRIHVMINRVIHTPIKAGPNKTVVMEFKSQEAIDAYIIRCLLNYCALWKKTFDADGPVAVTSAEPGVVRSEKDPVAVEDDDCNANPVRLESGST